MTGSIHGRLGRPNRNVISPRLAERVREHLKKVNEEKELEGIEVRSTAALSREAVCIQSSKGQQIIYFNAVFYNVSHPEQWGESLFPESTGESCLGILPGPSMELEVDNYDGARKYAKEHLTPRVPKAHWHRKPINIRQL